jgi:uncharacterized membrane protein YraQ (UPF0718 family)
LTVPVFAAPLLSPVTVTLTCSLLGWRMTQPGYSRRLSALRLLGVLINHGEQWFTAPKPARANDRRHA